jgi:uncharacterized protein (DUF2252 family)
MAESPFTFYRGAASIMASDLQSTPHSGIRTQISGDAHLLNFGAYASPERRYVFDLNDFDETIGGGAWEWDLKRLTTSVYVAARHLSLTAGEADDAVRACARSYRERMARFGRMRVLDIWYARIDEALLAAAVRSAKRRRSSALERPSETAAHLFPTLATGGDGQPRIVDNPPLVFHPPDDGAFLADVRAAFANYHRSLAIERRALFERFGFADAAYKVVGVGSVGTRCYVSLLLAATDDPLFLQLKEARASVYERYVRPSPFADHGERVVAGQRLMQATSDVFLGWARASDGRTYYVRQLRDLKTSADVDHMRPGELNRYGVLCGWALARAHAKAGGEPAKISGYLGRTGVFDEALVAFARDYAGQNERDYEALLAAVKSGRVVSR